MANNMKPSGIEWIGKIPSDWGMGRIKYCYDIILGKMLQPVQERNTDKEMYYMCSVNVTWDGIDLSTLKQMWFSPSEIKMYLLQKGDLLVTEGGDIAIACIWNNELQECCIQNALHLIKYTKNHSNKFLYYWLYFLKHTGYIDLVCNKATIAHFTKEKFGESPVCVIPLNEQKAITAFLDAQCNKIDSIITELEQQIEILKQYKTSLITETVTKGLNKDAPMKDSGIDWIGKIPAHWEVGRIKDLMILQRGYDLPQNEFLDGKIPVYGSNGIIGYHNKMTTKGPNISIGRSGSIGEINYIVTDSWIHNTAIFVEDMKKNYCRYLYYVLLSNNIKNLGNGSAVPTLDRKNIQNAKFVFTKQIEEQKSIATFLDGKCKEITDIITEKQQSIDTMRAYKKSLIYEYVTGKKRVKGYL